MKMSDNTVEFRNNILIKCTIICDTGMHIGGLKDNIGIGGTDSPVILGVNNAGKRVPIIPGSSIKGKMRSLMELAEGKTDGGVCKCSDLECAICTIFGRGANDSLGNGPTRLIVRDAYPTEDTYNRWNRHESIVHGTEVKGENTLNRVTSEAKPRFIERVPAFSEFALELVYGVYTEKDEEQLKYVLNAMSMLEDSYIGGSGSRGYGKIHFANIEAMKKSKSDYKSGGGGTSYLSCDDVKSAIKMLESKVE